MLSVVCYKAACLVNYKGKFFQILFKGYSIFSSKDSSSLGYRLRVFSCQVVKGKNCVGFFLLRANVYTFVQLDELKGGVTLYTTFA